MKPIWTKLIAPRETRFQVALDRFTNRIRWISIPIALVVGNLITDQRIGFNTAVGIAALYAWMASLRVSDETLWRKLVSIYLIDVLLITSFCYFTGGANSPFRFYYIPIVIVSVRYGFVRSLTVAVMAILLFCIVSVLASSSVDILQLGFNLFTLLILPFVISPIVGPRIHSIARQTAENVIKSQDEISRLQALNALSKSLVGPLGHHEWIGEAVQRVAGLFKADASWIYDYDDSRPDGEQLHLLSCYGIDPDSRSKYETLSLHVGVTGYAIMTSQTDSLNGPGDERTVLIRQFPFVPPHEGFPFRIAIPLIAHGRSVGVLTLANHADPGRPSEELELIRTVANQIAIAIDNARLYEQEKRRRAQALAVSEITKAAQFGLELDDVLLRITHELKLVLQGDLCQVWLTDEEESSFLLQFSDDDEAIPPALPIAAVPLLENAVRSGSPVYEMHGPSDRQFARSLHMQSLLALPLLGHGRITGVIVVGYQSEVRFRPEEKELIHSLADQIAASVDNVQLYESIRSELHNRSVLYRFMRNLSVSSRLDEITESFFAEIHQLLPVERTLIMRLNKELKALDTLDSDGFSDSQMDELSARMIDAQDCWAIKRGDKFLMRKGERALTCDQLLEQGTQSQLHVCLPLSALSETLGVVQISLAQDISQDQLRLLETLCEQLAVAIHRVELYEQIQKLAERDPLTDAYNYGYFQRQLKLEIARAKRNRTMLSLLYLDIDHFKQFNDTFGHPVGDQLLRRFTKALQRDIRAVDLIARLGGEEFAVLLPDTSKRGAITLAEKLRRIIENIEFIGNAQQPVVHKTVSIGIATYPEDTTDGDELIRKADDALYRAKSGGRNQVATA